MSSDLTPLALPENDWESWLGSRIDDQLDQARAHVSDLKQGGRDAAATLALWNDASLALSNAFAVASLLSNVHPDEAVRSRGEKGEQEKGRAHIETDVRESARLVQKGVRVVSPGPIRPCAQRRRPCRRAGVSGKSGLPPPASHDGEAGKSSQQGGARLRHLDELPGRKGRIAEADLVDGNADPRRIPSQPVGTVERRLKTE